jgi:hypothetical protein
VPEYADEFSWQYESSFEYVGKESGESGGSYVPIQDEECLILGRFADHAYSFHSQAAVLSSFPGLYAFFVHFGSQSRTPHYLRDLQRILKSPRLTWWII